MNSILVIFGLSALLSVPAPALAEAPERPAMSITCRGNTGEIAATYMSHSVPPTQEVQTFRDGKVLSQIVNTNTPYVQFNFKTEGHPFNVPGVDMIPDDSNKVMVEIQVNGQTFLICPGPANWAQ